LHLAKVIAPSVPSFSPGVSGPGLSSFVRVSFSGRTFSIVWRAGQTGCQRRVR
jgi:hypothetical protein